MFGWEVQKNSTYGLAGFESRYVHGDVPTVLHPPYFKVYSRKKLCLCGEVVVVPLWSFPPKVPNSTLLLHSFLNSPELMHSNAVAQHTALTDEMLPAAHPDPGSESGSFQAQCLWPAGRNTGKILGVWQSSLAPAGSLTSCWVWGSRAPIQLRYQWLM